MAAVVELLVELAGVPVEVERDEARVRPAEIRRLAGDASRLRAATDWRPEIPLERTLADALAAARTLETVP
jgi:GDP-4-dehydro-6-deoxy-D-mannose reductase